MQKKSSTNIFESDSLLEITQHLSPGTAILFDIDNTLIEPEEQFGSVQWAEYYEEQLLASGTAVNEVNEILQNIWNRVLPNLSMRLLDPESPSLIQQWRKGGHLILGLTARHPYDAPHTHPQLEKLSIQFDLRYADVKIETLYPSLFEKGVIFASVFNSKSAALLAFFRQTGHFPHKIIFIDDKLEHIEDVAEEMRHHQIDCVGIRYSKADRQVQEFNPEIAEIQMRQFYPSSPDIQSLVANRATTSLSFVN